jgi:hypothetical protein
MNPLIQLIKNGKAVKICGLETLQNIENNFILASLLVKEYNTYFKESKRLLNYTHSNVFKTERRYIEYIINTKQKPASDLKSVIDFITGYKTCEKEPLPSNRKKALVKNELGVWIHPYLLPSFIRWLNPQLSYFLTL